MPIARLPLAYRVQSTGEPMVQRLSRDAGHDAVSASDADPELCGTCEMQDVLVAAVEALIMHDGGNAAAALDAAALAAERVLGGTTVFVHALRADGREAVRPPSSGSRWGWLAPTAARAIEHGRIHRAHDGDATILVVPLARGDQRLGAAVFVTAGETTADPAWGRRCSRAADGLSLVVALARSLDGGPSVRGEDQPQQRVA